MSSISFFNINKKMLEREGETPHFSAFFPSSVPHFQEVQKWLGKVWQACTYRLVNL